MERFDSLRSWKRVVIVSTIAIVLVVAAAEIGWHLEPYLREVTPQEISPMPPSAQP